MKRSIVVLGVAGLCLCVRGSTLRAQTPPTLSIPLTVSDVTGYVRSNDPVTSGIPIPLSAVGDSWSLFDGATEVPLQTQVLSGQAVPWLMLDFPASVSAMGTTTYTLQNTAPTAPADSLSYVHTSSSETVTTGPLKFTVGTSPFLGIQDLWFDANANDVFEVGEHRISSGSVNALRVTNAETGVTTAATPTSVSWESQGTQRATLRIDGTFTEASSTLLTFTLRMTAWAGRSDLGIELVLRNSNSSAQKFVKLSSAIFQIGSSATTLRPNRSSDRVWGLADATGQTIQWLPVSELVSTAYDPVGDPRIERQTALFTVDTNGGLVLGDLSHQSGSATIDFNSGLSPLEQASAQYRAMTPLFARADASWYSAQNALGVPGFGTLADEQSAYTAWNWTWPNPNNGYAAVPHLNRPTNFYPSWSNTNGAEDPEGDFVAQNNLMFIRLGDQAYKDRMDAYVWYAKNQWIYRTDGFTAYGNDYWDGPHAVNRGTDTIAGATSTDQNRITKDIAYGRVDYSHAWASGLVDYYYLTGDRDALDTAIDVAEECRNQSDWFSAGTPSGAVSDSPRAKARCWQSTLRVWEATGDAQWLTSANHYRDLFLQSTSYSAERMYFGYTCDLGAAYCARYPNGTFNSPFQIGDTVHVMYHDYVLFNNQAVKDRLIEIANFAMQHGLDPATGATGDYIVFVGSNVYHHTYSQFRGTTPTYTVNYSSSSLAFIDTLAIGYRLNGNLAYLGRAKSLLSAATKRLGIQPYTETIADANHVGQFIGNMNGNANTRYNDDLTYTALFLRDAYLADSIVPGRVTNLSAQ